MSNQARTSALGARLARFSAKAGLLGFGLALLVLLTCGIFYLVAYAGTRHRFRATDSLGLREDEAVEVTRRALQLHQHDISNWVPYRFDGTNLLSRNIHDPNDGYV